MNAEKTEIRIAGKTLYVPSAEICGRTVVVTGNWLRVAAVNNEDLVEGEVIKAPEVFIEQMRKSPLRADILTFAQKPTESAPKYRYHFQWDNWAAIPISKFEDWWETRLPQESRKNVRRAAKRGVVVKVAQFDDELVKGIQAIYNETPVRQGKHFWHFGKDFETVKQENGDYLERSEFLGAYFDQELIGYIKIIYVDRMATLVQILAKGEHQDKRPMNALLAKAVEVCESKHISHLLYGKYVYDEQYSSPLTEFKRRNGFEEIKVPRYFVPLSVKGELACKLGAHKGARAMIPTPLLTSLKRLRSQFYRNLYPRREASHGAVSSVQ
jgi:hypothetical protein